MSTTSTDIESGSSKVAPQPEATTATASKSDNNNNKSRRTTNVLLGGLIVTVAASAVGLGVGLSRSDDQNNQYQQDASMVMNRLGSDVRVLLEATQSISVSTVSYANSTNQSFPFVTLPDFASRMSVLQELGRSVFTTSYMVVKDEDREAWEEYAKENSGWVQEGVDFLKTNPSFEGPIIEAGLTYDVIHDYGEYEKPDEEQGLVGSNRTDVYYPNWQNYPVIPRYAPYNWDIGSIAETNFIDALMEDNRATLSYSYLGGVYVDSSDEQEVSEAVYDLDWIKDFIGPDDVANEPVFDIYYPILTEKDGSVVIDPSKYEESSSTANLETVGMYAVTAYWRDLLQDILPEGSSGVDMVFSHCVETPFTYRVAGPEPEYLGAIDAHNPKYDDSMIETTLNALMESETYTGVPLHDEYCPYTIRIYPACSGN